MEKHNILTLTSKNVVCNAESVGKGGKVLCVARKVIKRKELGVELPPKKAENEIKEEI